ncbi:MAG TPA: hypothetical protein VGQ35_14545 [Dongiaceae bacterium]|nr:hypothetical protein [Dongiaceae bacterium]
MSPQIALLIERIKSLEAELDAELAKRRAGLRIGIEHGRIVFEQELLRRHRELQVKLASYLLNARPLVILTAPVIYSLIVPFVLLDLFIMLYQAVCFPVYGIPRCRVATISSSTGRISPISMPSRNSIAPTAPTPTASSPMSARSHRAQRSIGVRSSMPSGSSERMHATPALRITATPRLIAPSWKDTGPR